MIHLLIIAGTEDGREIVAHLAALKTDITVTVTTNYGASLIKLADNVKVIIGKWDQEKIATEIVERQFNLVIDASHPYAANVSQNAMIACKKTKTPYLRYERKGIEARGEQLYFVGDYNDAVALCNQIKGNLFFAIGSNHLETFANGVLDFKQRAFVRILPTSKMVKKTEALGLTPKHIIAMQGPFSKQVNLAMLKQVGAKAMITKESGDIGGFSEKVAAANAAGAVSIIIKRPRIDYDVFYSTIEELIKAVKVYIKQNNNA